MIRLTHVEYPKGRSATLLGNVPPPGSVELWTPVRYVHQQETCYSCFRAIPKASPGPTTGTRGTRCFYERTLDLWQCIECRAEETRAELAGAVVESAA